MTLLRTFLSSPPVWCRGWENILVYLGLDSSSAVYCYVTLSQPLYPVRQVCLWGDWSVHSALWGLGRHLPEHPGICSKPSSWKSVDAYDTCCTGEA